MIFMVGTNYFSNNFDNIKQEKEKSDETKNRYV